MPKTEVIWVSSRVSIVAPQSSFDGKHGIVVGIYENDEFPFDVMFFEPYITPRGRTIASMSFKRHEITLDG